MIFRRFFQDPVAVKELSGSARRWQTYASRVLYVGVIGFVLWNFSQDLRMYARYSAVSDYARLGRDLFQIFFALQMIVVSLSAVSAAADLVTKEVRAGTLGLLASTPLTPWRIAAGKWKASLAQTATLILCGAPVLSICVYLGGAKPWDLLYAFILSLAAAALSAALALYLSTRFRSGVTVILVSIGLLGIYSILPILAIETFRYDGELVVMSLFTHPVYAGMMASSPRSWRGVSPELMEYGWIGTASVCAVVVLNLIHRTAARIAVLSTRTPAPPILTRTFEAMDRFYETLGPARLRGIRLFSDRAEVWDRRAILWKELRTRASGKLRNAVRIAVALLLLLSGVFTAGLSWLLPLGGLAFIGFLFMALANGAGLFVTEKEERKWDILLTTPLTSWEIVASKLLAGLVPLTPTATILLLFTGTTAWLYHIPASDLAVLLSVLFLPALLAYGVGAAASLRSRTLRGAFTASFGAIVALLVVLPVLLHNAAPLLNHEERKFMIAALSPTPYLTEITSNIRWGSIYYGRYNDVPKDALGVFVVLYLGFILTIVAYLKTRFNAISGRSR